MLNKDYDYDDSNRTFRLHLNQEFNLLSAMDDGKISVLVPLDRSAAFDTIDHEILLHHFHNVFGFGDTVLSWFQSY